jgi:hypothetical protein
MKQIKVLLALAIIVTAVATSAFTSTSSKTSSPHTLQVNPDLEYFEFTGVPGQDEGDPTKYTLIPQPSTSCEGNGTVCVIQAIRASSDPMDPAYNQPQFDVDLNTGFPYVDNVKVAELFERGL